MLAKPTLTHDRPLRWTRSYEFDGGIFHLRMYRSSGLLRIQRIPYFEGGNLGTKLLQ